MGNSLSIRELLGLKTHDQLVLDALESLASSGSKVTSMVVGGVWRTLTEIALEGLAELHVLFGVAWRRSFLKYATGGFLDLKADELGKTRAPATKARHTVVMTRESSSGNVTIAAGKIVGTEVSSEGDQLRFRVVSTVVSLDGNATADVEVEAEFAGSRYNVGTGYITVLVTPISGIASVTNAGDSIVSEGTDEETDPLLKERCYGAWPALSRGAVAEAYAAWAREVDGVAYVAVDDQHPRGPGTVDIIVATLDGVPSGALVAEVQALIDSRKPINDDAVVSAAADVYQIVSLKLWLHPTDGSESDILDEATKVTKACFLGTDLHQDPEVEAEIRETYEIEPFGVGHDLILKRIDRHLMTIEHVMDVEWLAPTANFTVAPNEIVGPFSLSIAAGRRSEL